jgi:hypothetical protein
MHLTFAKRICECPVCFGSAVRRSARNGFVERTWFLLALVWPYRCDDCDSRFWGFRRSYQPADGQFVGQVFSVYQSLLVSDGFTSRVSQISARLKNLPLIRTAASVSDRPSSLV